MSAASAHRLVIAYGTETVPPHLVGAQQAAAGLAPGCSAEVGRPAAPAVALDKVESGPLRLCDLRHPFDLPPAAQDLAHADAQLNFLRRHLIKLCGLWAKPQVAFVEDYFKAIHGLVSAREATLTAQIGDLAGLVELSHWCFAAPMPLPRAHVPVSQGSETVRADFLFRERNGLLALFVSQGTAKPSHRRTVDALQAAGVRVLDGLYARGDQTLLEALGPDFTDFTDAIDLPESPFHGAGIEAPA